MSYFSCSALYRQYLRSPVRMRMASSTGMTKISVTDLAGMSGPRMAWMVLSTFFRGLQWKPGFSQWNWCHKPLLTKCVVFWRVYIVIGKPSDFLRATLLLRPRIWFMIIASIFSLLYLYFVYNVIFYLLKKWIPCCYPCIYALLWLKILVRNEISPSVRGFTGDFCKSWNGEMNRWFLFLAVPGWCRIRRNQVGNQGYRVFGIVVKSVAHGVAPISAVHSSPASVKGTVAEHVGRIGSVSSVIQSVGSGEIGIPVQGQRSEVITYLCLEGMVGIIVSRGNTPIEPVICGGSTRRYWDPPVV